MGVRPAHLVRSARTRRYAGLVALILCVALVDVPGAWAKSQPIDGATGSATAGATTKSGDGSVEKDGKVYLICVPYFAKGLEHTFTITTGGKVVDSFRYTVPAAEGTSTVTTDKGVEIEIETIHTGGVNGSPSQGCFDYVLKIKVKKKKT